MSTLSQFPLSRLALLRRVPFWAQALAACALFAVVGVAALDDYGMPRDEVVQRRIGNTNANYIATGGISKLSQAEDIAYRYYGMGFEMPLLLIERALGLQDTRHIYLTRHLVMHLFFIAGGFACGMLAYRMLDSRWVALLVMLMFLLHPRLYAHSFFNTKDVPFATLLLIALYLAHRAFRKDTLGAFTLCGVVLGLAINLRPFALMLPPMILAMRAPDLWQAGRGERKRILATAGMFAAAAFAAAYITHPYYWDNPLRFIEGVRELSRHPAIIPNLFMGEIYWSDAMPWNFIPVWFAITAPPVTLLMGALGAAAVCWQAIARPLAALRDREIRFRVLLLGCFATPVAAAIALEFNIYQAWRHMYFLWGPFCLLAAVGLHRIAGNGAIGIKWRISARLPVWVRGGGGLHMARRALAYSVAGVGLITTATAMAALHPNQHVYFNGLTDTKTPGALGKRYDMDYWWMAHPQLLKYLLARYPDDTLHVIWTPKRFAEILPQRDRDRVVYERPRDLNADFYFSAHLHYRGDTPDPPKFHSVKAYGSDIGFILAPNSDAYRSYYRAEYNDVRANGTLLARGAYDIYIHDGALHYIKEDCAALWADGAGVFLHIFPADPADLPEDRRGRGFESRGFRIGGRISSFPHTAFLDGECITWRPLPDYPIARIATGEAEAASGGDEWRVDIDLAAHAAARAIHEGIVAGDYGKPAVQSHFDLYLIDNALVYLKEPCAPGDADARFFLHIFPADPADLPAASREFGFANLDFQFADYGADIGGKCVAARELPDYAIERVRTGQDAAALGGDEWRVDIDLVAHVAAQAVYEGILAGGYGAPVAQSDFDLYLSGNSLAYLKEPCIEGDADARFFLHIFPADLADLPADRRESGFANFDFRFADYGADIGGKCVAARELPDYAMERIRTGQNAAASGGGEWRADIELAAHAAAQAIYEDIVAGDYGAPVAQSDFDLYLRGNSLTYLKSPCAPGDADARFFLHITPADVADLPADRRERGFANLDFHFSDHGAYAGDNCVATRELPDYAIESIRTGQFVSGEGHLWSAEFAEGQ